MLDDLLRAIFSGPVSYRIFSVLLFILVIIWIFIGFRIRQNPVTKEEKDKLSPKVDIKLFTLPENAATPYKYPLKRYILQIQNRNKNSVSVFDFRIEFIFKNIVTEIKQIPLLNSGGDISVGGIRVYKKEKDGSISRYEEQPVETAITKNFTLTIQQAKIDEKNVNTNIVIFNCMKWPEESSFAGDIIIDLSKKPEIFKKPDKIGTYEGLYFYEIKGKKFSEKVSGSITN